MKSSHLVLVVLFLVSSTGAVATSCLEELAAYQKLVKSMEAAGPAVEHEMTELQVRISKVEIEIKLRLEGLLKSADSLYARTPTWWEGILYFGKNRFIRLQLAQENERVRARLHRLVLERQIMDNTMLAATIVPELVNAVLPGFELLQMHFLYDIRTRGADINLAKTFSKFYKTPGLETARPLVEALKGLCKRHFSRRQTVHILKSIVTHEMQPYLQKFLVEKQATAGIEIPPVSTSDDSLSIFSAGSLDTSTSGISDLLSDPGIADSFDSGSDFGGGDFGGGDYGGGGDFGGGDSGGGGDGGGGGGGE